MHDTPLQPQPGFVDVTFVVEPNYAGWRLDRYLCEKIRRLSRTRVQRILERSLVADRPLKPSTRVHPGLTFTLRRPAQAEPEVPEDIVVLYLDQSLLVLDKPAGLPIHPTARYHHNTLVKLLERRHGPSLRADPAHRLDRETSGLLVCGRGPEASRALMRAFQSGEVHKEYLAIVEGAPPEAFSVDAPIAEGTERSGSRSASTATAASLPGPASGSSAASSARGCPSPWSAASPRRGASTRSASMRARPASRWWGTRSTAPTRATSTASASAVSNPRPGPGSGYPAMPCTLPGSPSPIRPPARPSPSSRHCRQNLSDFSLAGPGSVEVGGAATSTLLTAA